MKKTLLLTGLIITIIVIASLYLFKTYLPEGIVILDTKARGRTGNQLFQYSAAYSLAKQTNSKLYILVDHKEKPIDYVMPTEGEYALDGFNIPNENIIYKNPLNNLYFKIIKNRKSRFSRFILKIIGMKKPEYIYENNFFTKYKEENNNRILFITDWFESPIFFQDYKKDLLEQFSLKKIDKTKLHSTKNDVSKKNSVCIHIRRGDMKPGVTYRYTSIEFQKQAINLAKKLIKEPKFYIFSDEINAVKEELGEIDNINFIKGNSATEDMYLMSNCANNIITRSTFSWWAAYLNKNNGLVIAPYAPYNNESYFTDVKNLNDQYNRRALSHRTYPSDWILLNEDYTNLKEIAEKYITNKEISNEILKGYVPREFDIYNGNEIQLEICSKGDFKNNLCFLNNNLPNNTPTVVTAYFSARSGKHSQNNYLEWAKNFLQIPFNLVIYTDKENSSWIKNLRGKLPMILIERKIKEFNSYKYKSQFEEIAKKDKEINPITKQKNHVPELYIIWNEKINFVNEAIKINPYKSNFFIWCDIGTFREKQYVKNNFTSDKLIIQDKITFVMNGELEKKYHDAKYVHDLVEGAQANIQLGDIKSWKIYKELYEVTLKDLLNKNIPSGKEQTVMSTMVLRYPELFNLIYQDPRDHKNRWWYGLEYYSN